MAKICCSPNSIVAGPVHADSRDTTFAPGISTPAMTPTVPPGGTIICQRVLPPMMNHDALSANPPPRQPTIPVSRPYRHAECTADGHEPDGHEPDAHPKDF
jgi:hypothetical protein